MKRRKMLARKMATVKTGQIVAVQSARTRNSAIPNNSSVADRAKIEETIDVSEN